MIDPWNKVYTALKKSVSEKCTDSGTSSIRTPSDFPYMSVVQLNNGTTADDLENEENAITSIFEITVFSNKNQTEPRNIMSLVCEEMRKMGYRRTGPFSPANVSDVNVYRVIYRFSRIIGEGEEF